MKTDGMYTWKFRKARIQLYWPELTWRRDEVFLGIDSVLRYVNRPAQHYWGIGGKVLGFGMGFDYYSPPPQSEKGT